MYTIGQFERLAPHWLLEIEVAGRTFRFADATLDVTTNDGTVYHYEGQVDAGLTVEREVAGVGRLPTLQSASFQVLLPVDLAELVAKGHSIAAGTAELSMWLEGESYESRDVMLRGRLDDSPTFGESGEPFSFSITEEPFDDIALTHGPDERVSEDTWPDAADNAAGEWYPLVFGQPGYVVTSDGTVKYRPASPAPLVSAPSSADIVLIAGHPTVAGATGAAVTIYQASDRLTYDTVAAHSTDGLGRTVTTASISGASSAFRSLTATYWCSWKGAGAFRRLRDKAKTLESAGEVLTMLLERSSLDIDRGAFRALEDRFGRPLVAGFIDEPVSPWEYVRDHLLPILPLGLVSRGGSLTPILLPVGLPKSQTIMHLVEGQDISRTSYATVDAGDHVNELTISYALNAESGSYERQIILTPNRDPSDADQTTGPYARSSFARFGLRPKTLRSDVLYNNGSARLVAHRLVHQHWTPPHVVEYTGGRQLNFLTEGAKVRVTDAGLHFAERVAVVTRIARSLSTVGLELRFDESLVRDSIEV